MVSNTGPSAINRILYVDDEPGMLEICKLFLEDNQIFRVDTSPSASEALLRLDSSPRYDAIVSDFEMPKMNGIAFLKTLRAKGDTTPFIIFTGRGREDVVIEALNSGADYYIQKGGDPTAQFAELEHKIFRAIARKRSDLALQKSEQDYRQLIEYAGEAIFVIQDEVFRLVNPRASALSGYAEEELLDQPFIRCVHPDEAPALLEAFRGRTASGFRTPAHYTFRIIRKDTTIRWVELSVVAITWNERPAILNFMIDITERKIAEDALKESEERYRHLIEHAGEAIFVTQDEVFRLINPKLIQDSGFSEQELLGQPISRFVHPDDAPRLLENFRKRMAGATDLPTHYIFRILRKDGTIRWVELSVVGITWNERPAILNFMMDITDRKLSEDALRESEERYRHLIEHAGEGVYVVQNGCLQMANPQTTEMCGYTEQELLGVPFRKFVHPDDYEMLIDRFTRRISGENPPSSYPFRILRKDGTIRWVELSVGTITWKGAPATLNYATDIHDRKLAEDALRENEERYREFFRTSLDCVFITKPNGDWIDFNDATVKMFGGSSREEIAQRNVHSFYVNPEERAPLFRKIEEMGYIKETPLQLQKMDGTPFDAVVTSVPLKNPDGTTKAITGTIRDITEIKQAGDALRESEERYRQVFRTTLDGLFITTLEGEWVDFNDAVIGMFGCRNRDEVFSIPIRDFYADSKDREAIVQRTLSEGYVKEYPLKYRRRNGTTFDALMTVVAWKNPDGSTKRFIGTLRDITERKRTEDALRESEERYRQFFRTTLDGLFITTMDGRWIDFNEAIVDLLGYPDRETLCGVPITSVYTQPEERDLFIAQVERDGYVREYPVQVKKRDSSIIQTLMTVALQRRGDGAAKALIGTIRDVTERRRSDKALKESEDRYRIVTQLITDIVWDWDLSTGSVLWLGDIDSLLGCGPGEFPRTLEAWERILHPDDHDRVMAVVQRSLARGEHFDEEYRLLTHDGTYRYFHDRATIITDDRGTAVRMIGALTDITERRRFKESLRESEERYRHIFESFEDLYYQTDNNGIITILSPSVFRLTGFTAEELTGQPVEIIYVNPGDRQVLLDELARTGRVRDYEVLLRKKDGTPALASLSANRIYHDDSTPAGVAGTLRDITRRKEAENALRKSEEKYRFIVENAGQAMTVIQDNRLIFVNPKAAEISGYSTDELMTMPAFSLVHPDDRETTMARHMRRIEGKPVPENQEIRFLRKDGTVRLLELNAVTITWRNRPATLNFYIDVTKRKQSGETSK